MDQSDDRDSGYWRQKSERRHRRVYDQDWQSGWIKV